MGFQLVTTLLVRGASALATMGDAGEIPDGGLFARDGLIEQVGPSADLPKDADEIIDARHMVVMPGFVNAHHHVFQALTRCIPEAQNARLEPWLAAHGSYWSAMDAEAVNAAARVALAESALSGCTTVADQLSHFPNDVQLDVEIEAAREMGVRFVAVRGTRGEEDSSAVLADSERLIRRYHDGTPGSRVQIAVGPSNLLRFPADASREWLELARTLHVRGHTHIGETHGEIAIAAALHRMRPLDVAESLGWIGSDVWYAHGCYLNPREVRSVGRSGGAIVHCPTSNMKLGSRLAPLLSWLRAGVKVGLGVDGSSSNDTSNFLLEARTALLAHRPRYGPERVTARLVLELATAGGAAALGRSDIGRLVPGYRADFIGFDTRRPNFAGSLIDPVAAVIFCAATEIDLGVVEGRVIVQRGSIPGFDREQAVVRLNRASAAVRARAQRL